MAEATRNRLLPRLPAMLALALPVLAGLAYLAAFGAPLSYLVINASALVIALAWMGSGALPGSLFAQRLLVVAALGVMALPLFTGPEINGVSRWITFGPLALNTGALAVPLLAVLAGRMEDEAPAIVLMALFLCLLQPDAAAAFALMLSSVGMYFAWHDWKPGIVAILAFFAGILASLRGELPAQPFVERILADLMQTSPIWALVLLASLVASFFLVLRANSPDRAMNFALAGALAGFSIASLLSNYPAILIGYGASAILGFGLALVPMAGIKAHDDVSAGA